MATFTVSSATADDMRLVSEWAAAEGWHPGDGDETVFFATDPTGFLVGRLDEHPVSAIAAVRYGAGHGWLGLHLTALEHRGKGYGLQTWRAGLDRLAGRSVGLDSVTAQLANHRSAGFRDVWTTTRYDGVLTGAEIAKDIEVVAAREVPFAELAAYDRRFFPAERDAFLALWITGRGRHAVAAIRDDRVAGFAVRRPAGDTDRVGPVFADSTEIAESLLAALSTDYEMPVLIDVPGTRPEAAELVGRLGLQPVAETVRMYTTGQPDVEISGVYAVTSLELG